MRTAVMQPYLFPYIGYFQLISAVDTFVFFDDVNFITQGYIHRNAIEINGKKSTFTIPLSGASQNSLINEVAIHPQEYAKWWRKFQKSLKQQYASAPYFEDTLGMLTDVFDGPPNFISTLAEKSVIAACGRLGLDVRFERSSEMDYNRMAAAQEKVLEICDILGANTYINPIGGVELYEDAEFKTNGMELYFCQSKGIEYPQKKEPFLSNLSIIDVLMYNGPGDIGQFLEQYELLKQEQL
ncbi:MAG: WbqC family protein [Pricia sp.]